MYIYSKMFDVRRVFVVILYKEKKYSQTSDSDLSSVMTYAIVAGLCAAGAGFFGKLPSLAGQQGVRILWNINDLTAGITLLYL